jgi:hypothetical protein
VHRIVIEVEQNSAVATLIRYGSLGNLAPGQVPVEVLEVKKFLPDLSDESGAALFRQIDVTVMRILAAPSGPGGTDVGIDVVLPGSLEDRHTLEGSSRLNIRGRCSLPDVLGARASFYSMTSDVYLSAIGQLEYCLPSSEVEDWRKKLVLFVYINEGAGSLMLHKGEVIRGAGFGGPLGLLTVERRGQYFDEYRARGVLESYCSRPWMSSNIVNAYFSDRDKAPLTTEGFKRLEGTPLRRALRTISMDHRSDLDYDLINSGLQNEDPLACDALAEACDYLGLIVSHLIVAVNPHIIVLDGQMVHALRGLFEAARASVRRYTFPVAWNSTVLLQSKSDPASTLYGAAYAATHGISYHQR